MSTPSNPLKLQKSDTPQGRAAPQSSLPPEVQELLSPPAATPPPVPSFQPQAAIPGPTTAAKERRPVKPQGVLARVLVWGLVMSLMGGGAAVWFLGADRLAGLTAALRGAGDGSGDTAIEATAGGGMSPEQMTAAWAERVGALAHAVPEQRSDLEAEAETRRLPEERRLFARPVAARAAGQDWPDFQLNGVLVSSGNRPSSAILDGDMVAQDDSIEGMKVVQVDPRGAWFEYRGARKYVEVHERTR